MKIVILGAGAIGCFVGGCLSIGEHADARQICFLGREERIRRIGQYGLRLTDYTGWEHQVTPDRLEATTQPQCMADADYILIAVKSTGLDAALADIARYASQRAIIVTLQNGISPLSIAKAALPTHRIFRGMVSFNVACLNETQPGPLHWHKGTAGSVTVEDVEELAIFTEATSQTPGAWQRHGDMTAIAWGKLLLNLNNAVNALSGLTLHQQLSQGAYRRVLAAAIEEALILLKAADIKPARVGKMPPRLLPFFLRLPDWFFKTIGLKLQRIDAHARSSMADDFEAHRKTEIDFLNGEIVRLAETKGRIAPVNAAITALVKKREEGASTRWEGHALLQQCVKR